MIFFYYKKNIEHYTMSTESIQNIAKIYSDAAGTVNFNNLNIGGKVSNKLDVSGNISSTGSLNVTGETKLYNDLYYIDTDIRRLLIGCTVYNGAYDANNSFDKRDFHIGSYDIRDNSNFNDVIDVAVIYPGFGAYFYNAGFDGAFSSAFNYGTLPLRVRFGNPITVLHNNDPDYNQDSNTYYITGTISTDSISGIKVHALDINKWKAHRHS
jgi:hypothetical protein